MSNAYKVLKDIELSRLEKINIQELLGAILIQEDQNQISLKRAVKELVSVIFFRQIQISCVGKGDILFFFTPSYGGRREYLRDFNDVLNCAKNYTSFVHKKKFKLSVKNISILGLWLIWMKELRLDGLTFAYRMHLVNTVLSAYIYVENLDNYFMSNNLSPKLGVTFCDVHPVDYLVTAYLNDKGIETATLQHAVFEHEKFGWANTFSHSTYFLGISEVAKYEAMLSGADVAKFIVLGPMKYIENRKNRKKVYNGERAGLALSGPAFAEQNRSLLCYANELINEYEYTFIVRAHPALKLDDYREYLSDKIVLDNSTTMNEFADKCDFVIVGTSNTFGDILVTDTFAFRMVADTDFYSCIDDFKFNDSNSLKMLVNEMKNNLHVMESKLQNAKSMVCPSWDIKAKYCQFFDDFINKKIEEETSASNT